MREWDNDLDHRFVRLVVSVPEVSWMESSGIRLRGARRRRIRHTATGLTCAVAVMLVVGGGWLVACDGTPLPPAPPATHAPSAGPSLEPTVEIPVQAMITAADLGPDAPYEASDEEPRGDWPMGYAIGYCTKTPWQPPPSGKVARYRVLNVTGQPEGSIIMGAYRYAGDGAVTAMETYRTGLELCQGNGDPGYAYELVGTDAITADDVIVVRAVSPDRTMYYVYLRQGDVLAELAFYDGSDASAAVAAAAQAAQRLCVAVPTC